MPVSTIGIQASPAMALIMVAKQAGCFDAAGIDVDLRPFAAGKFALHEFLNGQIDFAVAGEVPVTLATLHGHEISVVAQIVERTTMEVRIVARRDTAAKDVNDYFTLQHRVLGTSLGGGPEYYVHQFLKKHELESKVTVIGYPPEALPEVLKASRVDAIAIFDPFAEFAEQSMQQDVVTFVDPHLYSELYVLVTRPQDKDTDKQKLDLILKALLKAQTVIQNNPEFAKKIVADYTGQSKSSIDACWNNFVFAPILLPALTDLMVAEVAWAKEKGMVPASTRVPDFSKDVIDHKPLEMARTGVA